jgi:hypothetical protein
MKLTALKAAGKLLREALDAMAASSNASGRASWSIRPPAELPKPSLRRGPAARHPRSPPDRRSSVMGANSCRAASCSSPPVNAKGGVSRRRRIDSMSAAWCRIASELCCMCNSRREMRAPTSSLTGGASEGEPSWEADIVVVCACGAHGKVSCRQYLHYGTGPHTTGSRRACGCRGVLENEAVLHGQQRSDRPSMGVGGQPHSPPGLVRISPPRPHRPMDACTHSSTKVQVARARTSTGQHRTRMPRARGSQDATPAPLLGAPSGMRAMARGAASADPRGSCHQPRRYHVSPAMHGSAGLLPRKTLHAVT